MRLDTFLSQRFGSEWEDLSPDQRRAVADCLHTPEEEEGT